MSKKDSTLCDDPEWDVEDAGVDGLGMGDSTDRPKFGGDGAAGCETRLDMAGGDEIEADMWIDARTTGLAGGEDEVCVVWDDAPK